MARRAPSPRSRVPNLHVEALWTRKRHRYRWHQAPPKLASSEHEATVDVVRRTFDIDEFVADEKTVLEVEIPESSYLLACHRVEELIEKGASDEEVERAIAELQPQFTIVRYCRLTNADIMALNRLKDIGERGIQTFFLMLSKADPMITYDKLQWMNPLITARITQAIKGKTPLFLR